MRSFYNDERVIKTKKLIKTALSELIQEKGFDHVSITDLTQRANINRGTFYLHYQDKYDLLEKFENEVLDLVNLFVPPALSSTMSGAQSKTAGTGKTALTAPASDKKVGRTEKADDQKSEKTIQNKESMS